MFKKINLILVGIGLALTLKFNIGFVFLLGVLLFYLHNQHYVNQTIQNNSPSAL